jgi:hypothetical protein
MKMQGRRGGNVGAICVLVQSEHAFDACTKYEGRTTSVTGILQCTFTSALTMLGLNLSQAVVIFGDQRTTYNPPSHVAHFSDYSIIEQRCYRRDTRCFIRLHILGIPHTGRARGLRDLMKVLLSKTRYRTKQSHQSESSFTSC